MIPLSQLRLALVIALILSLAAYHLTHIYAPTQSHDLFSLFKIVQFTVAAAFFFVLVYAKWLARIVLWNSYIGGYYIGSSSDYVIHKTKSARKLTSNPQIDKHIEVFTIVQNLFETRISGRSFLCEEGNPQLVSTWHGRLFKSDGETYLFGLELSTDMSEYAIIKATFEGQRVHGFYYSGEPGNKHSASFSASLVTRSKFQSAFKSPCG
jgi:hypothetical protein